VDRRARGHASASTRRQLGVGFVTLV
jgi:hypothetical protein